MLKWIRKLRNKMETRNDSVIERGNIDKTLDEIKILKDKDLDITPEVCRSLQVGRSEEEKNKLIKNLKIKIEEEAELGYGMTSIILNKIGEKLSYNCPVDSISLIHKDYLDEILSIFKNKGFNVNVETFKDIYNSEENLIIDISWN